jgi:hypothetical protein
MRATRSPSGRRPGSARDRDRPAGGDRDRSGGQTRRQAGEQTGGLLPLVPADRATAPRTHLRAPEGKSQTNPGSPAKDRETPASPLSDSNRRPLPYHGSRGRPSESPGSGKSDECWSRTRWYVADAGLGPRNAPQPLPTLRTSCRAGSNCGDRHHQLPRGCRPGTVTRASLLSFSSPGPDPSAKQGPSLRA